MNRSEGQRYHLSCDRNMSSLRDYSHPFLFTTKNTWIDPLKRLKATILFREAGEHDGGAPKSPTSSTDYAIGKQEVASVTRDHDLAALERHREASLSSSSSKPSPKILGLAYLTPILHLILSKAISFVKVERLSDLFKGNLVKGIREDDADIQLQRKTLGSNTYPRKQGLGFLVYQWEAWEDLVLIILMIAVAAYLALEIKTEGIKEGWCDEGTISFSTHLVICVAAINDYRQFPQFQHLNEKQNIHLEVIRGGKRVEVPIFDIVVGDVVPLKISDQVHADGILILCHFLALDESSITGEAKICKTVNAFQRVQIEEVEFDHEKRQDNSYWAKNSGVNSCCKAKEHEVLINVSP